MRGAGEAAARGVGDLTGTWERRWWRRHYCWRPRCALNFPRDEANRLGNALVTLVHGRGRSVGGAIAATPEGVFLEASPSGPSVNENGAALKLLAPVASGGVTVSVSLQDSVGARYVDSDWARSRSTRFIMSSKSARLIGALSWVAGVLGAATLPLPKIDFPADSPVALLASDYSGSTETTRGSALRGGLACRPYAQEPDASQYSRPDAPGGSSGSDARREGLRNASQPGCAARGVVSGADRSAVAEAGSGSRCRCSQRAAGRSAVSKI